eukprot:GCRY01001292.1.p2 GENE.GCRY01001292.1~~GCRY01001292.1.p2  ORF type:complete len:192 (-),score=38.67 GCRY01001292.1:911-1486(-)
METYDSIDPKVALDVFAAALHQHLQPTNTTKEEVGSVQQEVENVLTRIDEATTVVSMMNNDMDSFNKTLLPKLHEKAVLLAGIFAYIDQLEDYVGHVKASLKTLDDGVSSVEKQYGLSKLLAFSKSKITNTKPIEPTSENHSNSVIEAAPQIERLRSALHSGPAIAAQMKAGCSTNPPAKKAEEEASTPAY